MAFDDHDPQTNKWWSQIKVLVRTIMIVIVSARGAKTPSIMVWSLYIAIIINLIAQLWSWSQKPTWLQALARSCWCLAPCCWPRWSGTFQIGGRAGAARFWLFNCQKCWSHGCQMFMSKKCKTTCENEKMSFEIKDCRKREDYLWVAGKCPNKPTNSLKLYFLSFCVQPILPLADNIFWGLCWLTFILWTGSVMLIESKRVASFSGPKIPPGICKERLIFFLLQV